MEMLVGRGSCAPIGFFDRGEGSRFWTGDGGIWIGTCKIGGMEAVDLRLASGLSTYRYGILTVSGPWYGERAQQGISDLDRMNGRTGNGIARKAGIYPFTLLFRWHLGLETEQRLRGGSRS